jgi:two-component system response regulator MprA
MSTTPGTRDVLVVDDDPAIRELLQTFLEEEQFHVETASDGAQALQALANGPSSRVILLDLLMPGIDGRQVYRELERQPRLRDHHRLVIMTALRNVQPDDFPLAAAVLPKPFYIEDLLHLVDRLSQQVA